jgi:hypothetical protein
MPNLSKPKYRALLVGDNYINKIRYKSTGSCCVIYILSNAFLVEYLLTAISSMPDISTSVLKQKIYKTYMCSCYKIARLCKLQKGCTRLAAERVSMNCSAFGIVSLEYDEGIGED